MRLMCQQLELVAKHLGQIRRTIAHHRQTAAFFWTIWRKGSNDYMPTLFYALVKGLQIGRAIRWIDKKMKNRPVMPQIIPPFRVP